VLDVASGSADTGPSVPVRSYCSWPAKVFQPKMPHLYASPMQDAAMCVAARHGMVGVRMSHHRLAPANPRPSGARDVAAAASWLHQTVDLFGANRGEMLGGRLLRRDISRGKPAGPPGIPDYRFGRRRSGSGVRQLW